MSEISNYFWVLGVVSLTVSSQAETASGQPIEINLTSYGAPLMKAEDCKVNAKSKLKISGSRYKGGSGLINRAHRSS